MRAGWTSAAMAAICVVTLVGCDGLRGASTFTKRQAFSAKFDQVALIDTNIAEDRTLLMYVFTDKGLSQTRNGYHVEFSAMVDR